MDTELAPRLRDQLRQDLQSAEQSDAHGVEAATLRLVLCAVNDRDASARSKGECAGCPERSVLDILKVMADQRRESAQRHEDAGRLRDAERELNELAVIDRYLPKPLAGEDLEHAVTDVVEDLDASKLKDLGRCMTALKARYPGRIDAATAGKAVRRALG
ncbi:MAG: GatB/YqeY domain-containing protein [Pseudomonadota bacterium]